MENKQKSRELFTAVQQIINQSQGKEIINSLYLELNKTSVLLEDFFQIDTLQSIILSLIINAGLRDKEISLNDIINHFNKKIDKLSEIKDSIDRLIESNLITGKTNGRTRRMITNLKFNIEEEVLNSIFTGENILLNKNPNLTFSDYIEEITHLYEKKCDNCMDTTSFLNLFEKSLINNSFIKEIKWLQKQKGLESIDKLFLLIVGIEQINGTVKVDYDSIIKEIYHKISEQKKYRNSITNKSNTLINIGLLEYIKNDEFFDEYVQLSNTVLHNMFSNGMIEIKTKTINPKMGVLIYPESIQDEKLFYNPEEFRQINTLKNILNEENYHNVLAKLEENKLGLGINILLHGYAGTGKTASVKQIAKETNRAIYLVEIDKIKAKYIGDSEKNLKKVFEEL
jgi:hypothetical protein